MKRKFSRQCLAAFGLSAGLLSSLSTHAATLSAIDLAPGDLIISEVMANPAAVSDSRGEWFELYNPTAASIDLSGLTIHDTGSNEHVISGGLIGAGEYFVLGKVADPASNGGFDADYSYGSDMSLNNGGDALLISYEDTLIAELVYGNGFAVSGVSRALLNGEYQLTQAPNSYGDGDLGTPGSADPQSVSEVPLPGALWLFASSLAGLSARRLSGQRVL